MTRPGRIWGRRTHNAATRFSRDLCRPRVVVLVKRRGYERYAVSHETSWPADDVKHPITPHLSRQRSISGPLAKRHQMSHAWIICAEPVPNRITLLTGRLRLGAQLRTTIGSGTATRAIGMIPHRGTQNRTLTDADRIDLSGHRCDLTVKCDNECGTYDLRRMSHNTLHRKVWGRHITAAPLSRTALR